MHTSKINTGYGFYVYMTLASTGEATESLAGVDFTISMSKAGGGWVGTAVDPTDIVNQGVGVYWIGVTDIDMDTLGVNRFAIEATGCDVQFHDVQVVSQTVTDMYAYLTGASFAQAIEAELANDATGTALKQAIVDRIAAVFPSLDDLTLAAISTSVRDEVLNRVLAGNHTTVGSLGRFAQNLDQLISTNNAIIAAINAKTDNLPASPAAVGSAMTLSGAAVTAIVTALLGTSIDGETFEAIMTNMKASEYGDVDVTDNGDGTYTIAFKKNDGTTTAVTKTYDPATGLRT